MKCTSELWFNKWSIGARYWYDLIRNCFVGSSADVILITEEFLKTLDKLFPLLNIILLATILKGWTIAESRYVFLHQTIIFICFPWIFTWSYTHAVTRFSMTDVWLCAVIVSFLFLIDVYQLQQTMSWLLYIYRLKISLDFVAHCVRIILFDLYR